MRLLPATGGTIRRSDRPILGSAQAFIFSLPGRFLQNRHGWQSRCLTGATLLRLESRLSEYFLLEVSLAPTITGPHLYWTAALEHIVQPGGPTAWLLW